MEISAWLCRTRSCCNCTNLSSSQLRALFSLPAETWELRGGSTAGTRNNEPPPPPESLEC